MKGIIMFSFFIGSLLIILGICEQKIKIAEETKEIEYKLIPRTYYEEQMSKDNVSLQFADMFNYASPWYDRTIGNLSDIPDFRNLRNKNQKKVKKG